MPFCLCLPVYAFHDFLSLPFVTFCLCLSRWAGAGQVAAEELLLEGEGREYRLLLADLKGARALVRR